MFDNRSCANASRNSGFSLVELAITLVIVGVLASSVLVPLVSQMAARNIAVTEKTLTEIKDALIGYAAANGRLPCPATSASNGIESPVGGGTCTTFYGFLPAVTLGINPVDNQGYALDGWGSTQNRVRYAVSNKKLNPAIPAEYTFTTANGMRNATIATISATTLLYVCASGVGVNPGVDCGAALTMTSNAPVVVWSVGANAATGGTSTDESQNPNPNNAAASADVLFVSHSISASTVNPFDDIVTWIGVPTLINRMIAAGQLP